MNAYELADQLDNVKYQNGAKPFEMYANMLRQQADRIAELEMGLELVKDAYFVRDSECKKLKSRIAELEKAAQRMVDEFAPHADKCRPCTIEWQNLRNILVKEIK